MFRRCSRRASSRGSRLADEIDVDDVVDVGMVGVPAVLDGAEVVVRSDDAFGEQEPRRELAVGPRRAHDDRERAAVQPDLERLLGRGDVLSDARRGATDARHADTAVGRTASQTWFRSMS